MGSLIRLLEPLEINGRLVRTAVSRLVKDGWLDAIPQGRKTDYKLSASGWLRFEEASRHIYASDIPMWDRRWRLIMVVNEIAARESDQLRKALNWKGFGVLSRDCFIHPNVDLATSFDSLRTEGLGELIPYLKAFIAVDVHLNQVASDKDVVNTAWDIQALDHSYMQFLKRYQPILDQITSNPIAIDDESAFLLRCLLIQDFRKALLRDPELPRALLPSNWSGYSARIICKEIYRRLIAGSERHLNKYYRLADGSCPPESDILRSRFIDADPIINKQS